MTRSGRARWLALCMAISTLVALALPLSTTALATHGNCVLDVQPETDSNVLGQSHSLTATLRPAGAATDGSSTATCTTREGGKTDVSFEVIASGSPTYSPSGVGPSDAPPVDLSCEIHPNDGSCNVSYSRLTVAGSDTIRAWFADATADTGETQGSNDPDATDVVSKTWTTPAPVATFLNVTPESASNTPQSQHTVTATVRDQTGAPMSGVNVDVEIMSGPNQNLDGNASDSDLECTTATGGTCAVTYTDAPANPAAPNNVDTICGWLDRDGDDAFTLGGTDANDGGDCDAEAGNETEDSSLSGTDTFGNDATDKVTKTWQVPTAATRLDCSPETENNAINTAHTITCTATNSSGAAVPGVQVDAEATGTNDPDAAGVLTNPDFSCTTASDGRCSFTHPASASGTAGTTTYRAWIDADGSNTTAEADATEARDSAAGAGSTAEPDATDVVAKTWQGPSKITVSPSSDSASVGTCNPFTITVTNTSNVAVSGAILDVEQRHARATDGTANNEPTVAFCAVDAADGPNPSGVDIGKGDLNENPDNRGTLGGETTVATDANGKVTIGISVTPGQGSDGTGTVSVSVFYETSDNDDPDSTEPDFTASKAWVTAEGRTIDCEPETATSDTGTLHTVTCTVRDRARELIAGESVTFTETGPGQFTTSSVQTTDFGGRVSVVVGSSEAGTQTITGTITDALTAEPGIDECDRAAGDPAGSPAGVCSDSVLKTWTKAPVIPPECAGVGIGQSQDRPAGGKIIVGTLGPDTLVGTEQDDIICALDGDDLVSGLGGDDVILAGIGNDLAAAGEGRDDVRGGEGNDELRGSRGKDNLRGGAGNDLVRGGRHDDILRGGAGDDVLVGYLGDDFLIGGPGIDRCRPGRGRDTVRSCELR